MKSVEKRAKISNKEAIVVTNALMKAAELWNINNRKLGEICGLSEATISRLRHEKKAFDPKTKSWELAIIMLRIFRSLDSLLGGNINNQLAWLNANNIALGGKPIELMKNIEGISNVARYLDYMRGSYS